MTKKKSIDELTKEVISLKSRIGGYKKWNEAYRKKIKELKKLAAHNRDLDKEGDKLYEETLAKLEETQNELRKASMKLSECYGTCEAKEGIIEILQDKSRSLSIENSKQKEQIADLERKVKESNEVIARLSRSWWRKIFSF